jgi:hypothetical protein
MSYRQTQLYTHSVPMKVDIGGWQVTSSLTKYSGFPGPARANIHRSTTSHQKLPLVCNIRSRSSTVQYVVDPTDGGKGSSTRSSSTRSTCSSSTRSTCSTLERLPVIKREHESSLQDQSSWLSWLERWSHISHMKNLPTSSSHPKVESSSLSEDKFFLKLFEGTGTGVWWIGVWGRRGGECELSGFEIGIPSREIQRNLQSTC